jgi:hypothetical protein
MSHLGRWLSALVDGELDPAERDRVLNHLAGCSSCLREANEMRALKRRLTALNDSSDNAAIAGRLIELVRSEQGSFGRSGPARWPGERGKVRVPGRRLIMPGWMRQTQITRGWPMAAGSAVTALAAVGCTAFVLGSTAAIPPVPRVTPSVDSYVLQHAYDAGQQPASPGSSGSLARPGQGAAPSAGSSASGSYGRWGAPSGALIAPGSVAQPTASPTASTPGPVDRTPGKTPGRHRAQ